jgi:hypothetical protein
MLIPFGVLSAAGAGGEPVFVDAFEHIATGTGTGSNTTIEFTSIPTDYKHLQVRWAGKNTSTNNNLNIRINNISTNSYARHYVRGQSTGVDVDAQTSQPQISLLNGLATSSATLPFSVGVIDILDPFSTTKNTTIKVFYGNGTSIYLASGFLNNTTSVSSLQFSTAANAFAIGSRFSLYGIKG